MAWFSYATCVHIWTLWLLLQYLKYFQPNNQMFKIYFSSYEHKEDKIPLNREEIHQPTLARPSEKFVLTPM